MLNKLTGLLRHLFATLLFFGFSHLTYAINNYEQPATFAAERFLTPEQLSGPNHKVRQDVKNDSVQNHYVITSRYGTLEAHSTATALERIHEINIIAVLDEMSKTSEFMNAVESTATNVIDGAKHLVTNPIDSVFSTVSGMTKMLKRAGNTIFSASPADSEDGRLKALVGFTEAKRQYAAALKVDPYSDNHILQEYLDDISWTAFAGGLGTSLAISSVPGAAGTATQITGTTASSINADLTKAPLDLEKENDRILKAIRVSSDIRELFLKNETYPPSLETHLTYELANLHGVKNRDVVVKLALQTDQREVAAFRTRQVEMYAGYHKNVAKIETFLPTNYGTSLIAVTKDNVAVFLAPFDYLSWTAPVGRAFYAEQIKPTLKGKKKEVWVTGEISPRAKKELEKLGWQIHEHANKTLLK